MIEPLAKIMQTAGTELDFGSFTVQGILGFELDLFQHGEASPYGTERRQYTVLVTTADVAETGIVAPMQFTLDDGTYSHSFEVNYIEPDHTGMSELSVTFLTSVLS